MNAAALWPSDPRASDTLRYRLAAPFIALLFTRSPRRWEEEEEEEEEFMGLTGNEPQPRGDVHDRDALM